jgi:hypothetical protein
LQQCRQPGFEDEGRDRGVVTDAEALDVSTMQGDIMNRVREMLNGLINEHDVYHFTVVGMLETLKFEYIAASLEEEEE